MKRRLLTCVTKDCKFNGRVFLYRPERVGTWAYKREIILCIGCDCEVIDRENPPENIKPKDPKDSK